MTDLSIELNDSGIQVATLAGASIASPAYAIVREPKIVVGAEAYAQAKLFPRDVNNQYWHQLRLEPMANAVGTAQSHADLAYAHLMQVYEPFRQSANRVVIGVPPSFSTAQLGLLLGICQRAEMPIAGLVDTSVAGTTHPVPGQRMLVVDAGNHCVTVTELVVEHGLRRGEVTQLDTFGLVHFYTRWATFIGDSFVKNSRFDPMHSAASEQWLFDSLPSFIEQINASEQNVELASEDAEFKTTIDRTAFIAAVAGFYQPIMSALARAARSDQSTTVVVSDRIAALPGLVDLIEHHDEYRVIRQAHNAVCNAILADTEHFVSEPGKFTLVKQKPWHATPSLVQVDTQKSVAPKASNQATHVLIDSNIYPLGDQPFMLGTSLPERQWGYQISGVVKGVSRQHCSIVRQGGQVLIEDTSTYGSFVNGKRATSGQILHVGDSIMLGNPGIEIRLLKQVDYHG